MSAVGPGTTSETSETSEASEAWERLGLRHPERVAEPDAILGPGRRLRAWAGAHWRSLSAVAPLLVAVGVVHAWGVSHSPQLIDDEGTYVAQAWAVLHEHQLAPYTYWYDHPPLAWIQIAGWMWATSAFGAVTAAHAIPAARQAMVACSVISAGLLYLLARRLGYRRLLAAVAVGLFAFSPLALGEQRLVLLDNVAVPWLLAALVLAASPRRSLWAAVASGGCLAISILSKETFLLFAPAVVLMLWYRSDRRTRSFCLTGFLTTAGLLLAGYPLFAALRHELVPGTGHVSLVQAIDFQLFTRPATGNPFQNGTGANATIHQWLALDPWLLFLGILALPLGLAVRRLRPMAVGLFVPVLMGLRPGYLPSPYVIGLLPFAAVTFAGDLDVVADRVADAIRRHPDGSSQWRSRAARRVGVVGPAVVAGMLVALAAVWLPADRAMAAADTTGPTWAAEAWIERHVPRTDRLIVDDTVWVDLVEHGFDPHLGVVWYEKLDFTENLDPSVRRALPEGWRAFAYVVEGPVLRTALVEEPDGFVPVRRALAHSVVVASFGSGPNRVEVRRIVGADAAVADHAFPSKAKQVGRAATLTSHPLTSHPLTSHPLTSHPLTDITSTRKGQP